MSESTVRAYEINDLDRRLRVAARVLEMAAEGIDPAYRPKLRQYLAAVAAALRGEALYDEDGRPIE